jgi:hypothetical protein
MRTASVRSLLRFIVRPVVGKGSLIEEQILLNLAVAAFSPLSGIKWFSLPLVTTRNKCLDAPETARPSESDSRNSPLAPIGRSGAAEISERPFTFHKESVTIVTVETR